MWSKIFLGDILIIQHKSTHETCMLQNKKYLRMELSSIHAYHKVFYLCLKIMHETKEPEHYKS